jgi:O-antigen/teichoic acid export membrane protein
MVHFSGWNIFGTLGSILSAQGINIILNIFFGPVAVAARALSSQVGGGLNQFASAFQQAVTPQITKLFASNQIEELNRLLYQNAKYAFLLLWFLALPVLLETDYILSIWLVEIPENTALFCQLMIIHGLISSLNRPYVMAIHATGNMKQTNVTAGIILLLVIPVSYVLLDNGFSIIAPFIVYIIATILCFVIELYYLKKWIQVSIKGLFINTFIPIILIIVLTTTLPFWMQTYFEESFMRFFIVGIVSCVSVVFFTYVIALNRLEKEKFQVMIKNRIQKRKV